MKKSKRESRRLEEETAEQIKMNPIAAAERTLAQLSNACDQAIARVNRAVGDEALSRELLRAGDCFRRLTGFGHEVAAITGQRRFEQRWNFTHKLTPYQARRWLALKHGGSLPVAPEMPGKEILEALKAEQPANEKPEIFEGEDQYRAWLESQGLTEAPVGGLPETAAERRRGVEN
jgi:hypothetical protein